MCLPSQNDTPLDIVKYEIDMLRFCLSKLESQPAAWGKQDEHLHIEGGLLHYRNLIRFFSGNTT